MIQDSFLYCWTDIKTDMLYVGVHKGTPTDGYVCSSKYMLKEFNERQTDFSRQIIATGSYKELLKLEALILKSANAARDPRFYNKHNGDGRPYIEKHSAKTRQKMSRPKTEEEKQKFRGKRPHVDQSGTKNNAYKALKGRPKSSEFKEKNRVGQSKIVWTVVSPTGERYIFRNLRQGCKDNNIETSPSNLWLSAKKNTPVKGWQCFKDSSRFDKRMYS
jgi:hypothetical protein